MEKRYWLFGWSRFASGGMNDLLGRFNTLEEAQEDAERRHELSWWCILNIETGCGHEIDHERTYFF